MKRRSLLLTPLALAACSAPAAPAAAPARAPARARGPAVDFSYESLDDRPVSREALRGRAAIVAFLTTYGDPSLLQARFLKKVFREHAPRINAAAIFLGPPENRPLVRVFVGTADLPFPCAMGDAETTAGRGPFRDIDTVPSVLVLDHEGREVWRKVGVASADELNQALRDAQSEVWGASPRPR